MEPIEGIKGFSTINGYKVQEGKFYFTGIKDNQWNLYSIDLETKAIKVIHQEVENHDLYIALGERAAVYIDMEGRFFYRKDNRERKIDQGVTGLHRPNLLISPDQKAVLYTKGTDKRADLYLYLFGAKKPLLIKENITESAFNTFSFTTQWSHKGDYFIYNNEEIYNIMGQLKTTINATAAVWSPEGDYIAYIKKPVDLQKNKIIIGDWETYIGEEFIILCLLDMKESLVYKSSLGLIDPIDNIQWGKNAKQVGISVGKINKSTDNELEGLDYNKIFVYNLIKEKGIELEDVPYNYYEIFLDNYLYGSHLGKKSIMEIIPIEKGVRKVYKSPVLLNSKNLFVIAHKDKGYFVDGKSLMEISKGGRERQVIELAWEVNEMYLDSKTESLIITNKDMEIYLLKL